ncbi:CRTAC1 family protein [Alteromonas sp. MMG017]|uniref:CRTAC1 family protein n=1 Tax=Alteromonas sp. MMG017 TaxID=2822692 RepID=UPI001B3A6739|nr:CRTAC1 family protein [Alteromonas sp. MMG017]MBQ4828163.1 CRTAC1 family protein [Alteromonas sp. MMG017]
MFIKRLFIGTFKSVDFPNKKILEVILIAFAVSTFNVACASVPQKNDTALSAENFNHKGTFHTVTGDKENIQFEPDTINFPIKNSNLRKWDVPTVADLDQDGYPDLLLNDHGFSLKVLWNNNGRFAKPYDLIMGDMHGITAGDFDKDGSTEIAVSRGGGSGSNARNTKLFRIGKDRSISAMPDFDNPMPFMRGRTVKLIDLNQDGWLDMLNFAFPSREMKGESESYVFKNTKNGQFNEIIKFPSVKGDGQKTLVTDFNDDGLPDLIIYGNDKARAYQATEAFDYNEVTDSIFPFPLHDVTSFNEIDFDNDGDFDLFITRSVEYQPGQTFYDKSQQLMGYYWLRGAHKFPQFKAGPVIELINFQSQWPTKDLFVGESAYPYAFEGETHIGRNVRIVNSDALGFPDTLDKKGAYIGYVGNDKWQFATATFSISTGVIKGVAAFPHMEKPKAIRDVVLKNNGGKFEDVSQQLGIMYQANTVASAVADINNDGYSDLVIAQKGDLIHPNTALVFTNEQGKQLKLNASHGVISAELGALGLGVEPLDYDLDGQVDLLVGNDRGKWHLFHNTFSQNNFFGIYVPSSPKANGNAMGSVVEILACGNMQRKKVGQTSAAYSLSANNALHFGVGSCDEPVTVTITWSDKTQATKTFSKLNTYLKW